MSIELQPHLSNNWITLADSKRHTNYIDIPADAVPKVIELLRQWQQDREMAEGQHALPLNAKGKC